MKIAIPMSGSCMDQHFGHCKNVALIDVAPESGKVTCQTELATPEHQHGLLPRWLKEMGVTHVIAGGMGAHARTLLLESSIEVITGAPSETPAALVQKFLSGNLQSVETSCGHTCSH